MNLLNNKLYIFLFIVLIGYSIAAGLFAPLTPSVERLDYRKVGDSLVVDAYLPRNKEKLSQFYLKKSFINKENKTIQASQYHSIENGYRISFVNPEYIDGSMKGEVYDFVAYSYEWGNQYYFNAFFTDSVDPKYVIPSVELPKYKPKFHFSLPNKSILKESIRNLFFHVPMWFSMMSLLIYSLYQSVRYLYSNNLKHDKQASKSAEVAMYFGIMGLLTGMIWARYTWGAFWTSDPKLNGTAIGMLAYLAYFILRRSVDESIYRGKLSAVYNIFAFSIYMTFIIILPRLNDSLHPGNGGNPGFNIYEQDDVMRMIFYPAVIGWIMCAVWLKELYVKNK